jgi:hypothetical protein
MLLIFRILYIDKNFYDNMIYCRFLFLFDLVGIIIDLVNLETFRFFYFFILKTIYDYYIFGNFIILTTNK